MVPTVNNVALTGPDASIAGVAARPQSDRRISAGCARHDAAGAGARRARQSRADSAAPPQRLLDDLSSFQRMLFTNHRVRALADAVREGSTPLPDPDPRLNELEQQGKAVFERACAQCHGGPGQSTPAFPVNRFSTISSQCPRPVDTVTPARFAFARMSAATRPQCADLRDRAVASDAGPDGNHPGRDQGAPHELRSRAARC